MLCLVRKIWTKWAEWREIWSWLSLQFPVVHSFSPLCRTASWTRWRTCWLISVILEKWECIKHLLHHITFWQLLTWPPEQLKLQGLSDQQLRRPPAKPARCPGPTSAVDCGQTTTTKTMMATKTRHRHRAGTLLLYFNLTVGSPWTWLSPFRSFYFTQIHLTSS